MIDVDHALSLIRSHVQARPAVKVPLASVLGCVLAEDVASDLDSPPYDKALMDGYAVCMSDLASGSANLRVLEEVTAGHVPTKTVAPGAATRIMTGAPMPAGADGVAPVERTTLSEDGACVRIEDFHADSGVNILRQGELMHEGDVVLSAGKRIRPMEVGLLAEVGRHEVAVIPRPSVAVLSTGDELVPAYQRPGPGQIRNSNGPMLVAQVQAAGAVAVDLGVCPDQEEQLRQQIERGLEEDVLVLSGGVSAGVLDLVPAVLADLQVEQVFHKVRLKPGKPLWFGVLPSPEKPRFVFGLPGNPVSSLVCFELFVRPALGWLAGKESHALKPVAAKLASSFHHRADRPTFFPAHLDHDAETPTVTTLSWKGSADLRTLVDANCLIHFPVGEKQFAPGDIVEAHRFA